MAVRYGTMRTAVTGLTVVLPNGDIIKNRNKNKKKLLPVITLQIYLLDQKVLLVLLLRYILKLSPIPENIMSAVCQFPDLESAVYNCTRNYSIWRIPIARIEMY